MYLGLLSNIKVDNTDHNHFKEIFNKFSGRVNFNFQINVSK